MLKDGNGVDFIWYSSSLTHIETYLKFKLTDYMDEFEIFFKNLGQIWGEFEYCLVLSRPRLIIYKIIFLN